MKESVQLQEAFRLIREEVDKSGTAKKIAELEKQAPKDEEMYWGDVWSAFMAATDDNGMTEMLNLP